jgi:hypothetical protein
MVGLRIYTPRSANSLVSTNHFTGVLRARPEPGHIPEKKSRAGRGAHGETSAKSKNQMEALKKILEHT